MDPERGGVIRYGRSERPVCHFLCGFLVGVFQELLGIKPVCKEIQEINILMSTRL